MDSMALFYDNLGWAERICERWCAGHRVPSHAVDDCLQAVRIALWLATRRWDRKRAAFRTFAKVRIVHAIRDQLRVECRRVAAPRDTRMRAAGRLPPKTYSLQSPSERAMAGIPIDCAVEDLVVLPDLSFDDEDGLLRAMRGLSAQEIHVIRGVFWRAADVRQLATDLNVSGARICQIYVRAVLRLRTILGCEAGARPHVRDVWRSRAS